MSEKELQELNKEQTLKKALIGNAIMLFVLTVVIILAVFAWFVISRSDAQYKGIKLITPDERAITFVTYAGSLHDNTPVFSGDSLHAIDANIPDVEIMPGDTCYFKTIIKNYEQEEFTGTLVLQNMLVNKRVFDEKYQSGTFITDGDGNTYYDSQRSALTFGVEAKYNDGETLNPHLFQSPYTDPGSGYDIESLADHSYYLADPQPHILANGSTDANFYSINTQYVCADIFLPAATDATHPGTFTVVWEFKVSGKLANAGDVEVEGETQESSENLMGQDLLEFGSIRFLVDE